MEQPTAGLTALYPPPLSSIGPEIPSRTFGKHREIAHKKMGVVLYLFGNPPKAAYLLPSNIDEPVFGSKPQES